MFRIIVFAAALALGASAPFGTAGTAPRPAPDASEAVSVLSAPASSLETQVDAWIAELSKDEPFSAWSGATWRKAPLGPGTHGWIVFVQDARSGEPLGYLIVAATPEGGYALVEYGAGATPPFADATLETAFGSDGLEGVRFTDEAAIEPLYFDPLHAFWKVSEGGVTRYADAVTGAWLPATDAETEALAKEKQRREPDMVYSGKRLHMMKQPGDPYGSIAWLEAPDAEIGGWDDFVAWFDARGDGEAVYVGAAWGGDALAPFGVAGYHGWPSRRDGGLGGYVALDQEGLTRYAPLETLLAAGSFR
ncbi:hypothetical protein [Paenibacillus sp.]|uniref:hypothetical protein n=1 Tax=Paenibacillus sp. TaxID=58172 RepID=UPI002D31A647|nr:hypothetical protein [Paenibacillus sp.]HZG55544.1 hypothetical protein [Paenibacillus sp.]